MADKTSLNGFFLCAMTILTIGFFTLTATSTLAAAPEEDGVLARWGKHTITRKDMEARISQYPPDVQEKLKDPAQKRQFLEGLIQIQITGAEARVQKLDRKKTNILRIDDMTNSILAQEYMNLKLQTVKPADQKDAEAFYAANKSSFVTPVTARAQHILVEVKQDARPEDVTKAEAKAKKICDEIAAGGDFAKLAEKYSDDAESRARGGDMGTFAAEQVMPEFAKPVFSMKKDEISKPLRTPLGFHIVKLNDLTPARQMEFQEVKEDILNRLDSQKREQIVFSELERLKKKYKVKIY